MIKELIQDHPAGWRSILDDLECYCHNREKLFDPLLLTDKNTVGRGCEWAYVLYQENGKDYMDIYGSYNKDGSKMIGAFGHGDPKAKWKKVYTVRLSGREPSWNKIEKYSNYVSDLTKLQKKEKK